MRPRVLIEATPLISDKMSGVGNVLLETVKALDRSEYILTYDIRLFVPWDERRRMNKYEFQHIKIVRVPLPHKAMSLLSRMRVGIPLDIFLGKGAYVFPNFRNWNLLISRSYTYIHDVGFMIYPQYVEQRNLRFLTKYMSVWTKRANRIITVSQASKREIQQQLDVPQQKIGVVPNAVDTNAFYRRSAEEISFVKKKYGIGDRYFLYLGNIEPRKNLTTFIDAFVAADIAGTEIFLVGGDGWRNEAVYRKIEEASSAGYRIHKSETYVPDSDLPAILSGAIALVQPSWHEGFGLATIQALACGTRIICSDIPSLREVTDGNQRAAMFFNPESIHELTEALEQTYNAHSPITANVPTWSSSAEKLMEIIEEKYE